MKRIFMLALMLLAGWLCGCASDQSGALLPSVGPTPGQTTTSAGSLLVYTAHDTNPNFNNVEEYQPRYTDYQLMTAQGLFLQDVHNDAGTILQHPVQVKLPPGSYQVRAWANGRGLVTVPVIVAAQQLTVVHLDKDVKETASEARGL